MSLRVRWILLLLFGLGALGGCSRGEPLSFQVPEGWEVESVPDPTFQLKTPPLLVASNPQVVGSRMVVAATDAKEQVKGDLQDALLSEIVERRFLARVASKGGGQPKILERRIVTVAGVPAGRVRAEATFSEQRMGILIFVLPAPEKDIFVAYAYPKEQLEAVIPKLDAAVQKSRGLVRRGRPWQDLAVCLGCAALVLGVLIVERGARRRKRKAELVTRHRARSADGQGHPS